MPPARPALGKFPPTPLPAKQFLEQKKSFGNLKNLKNFCASGAKFYQSCKNAGQLDWRFRGWGTASEGLQALMEHSTICSLGPRSLKARREAWLHKTM